MSHANHFSVFFRNQMSCLGWIRAEMECLSARFYFAILRRDPFVSPQMIGPRFSHKDLDASFRMCREAELRAQAFHLGSQPPGTTYLIAEQLPD